MPSVILIGAPIDDGQRRQGCVMGPAAYRVAGIAAAIRDLGHGLSDWGDMALPDLTSPTCPNPAVHSLAEVLGWTQILADKVDDALSEGGLPIILGGDHSLALGTVAGAANFAKRYDPDCRQWFDRKAAKSHTILATKALACKLAKAAWYLMSQGGHYDAKRMFPQVRMKNEKL